jgi:hypothetical protein
MRAGSLDRRDTDAAADELLRYVPVSQRSNSRREDAAGLIDPTGAPTQV